MKSNENKKQQKTECIFAVNGNVATCNRYDKEACSNNSLNRGFAKCVYIMNEERAREYFKENNYGGI